MAYQIVRKRRFLNRLENLLAYLEREWSGEIATNFLLTLDEKIDVLKLNPFIGAPSGKILGLRSLFITKHNRLFYRIEKKNIIILNLQDTRKTR